LEWNKRIFDAGLATQPYDKGLEHFTAKLDPNAEMSAVIAIEPAAYTHVFQKYWDVLNNPLSHPNCNESEFIQDSMNEFAQALAGMNLSNFEPKVDAEADDKSCRIAQPRPSHGRAKSRMRPTIGTQE
jgi:hypothetical protein